MFWISMPSFHQRLLSHISLPNKNKYATSLWTLHQRKRTHPHPILQFFLYWFFFTKKNEQETKRWATLPTLKTKREPKKITFTSLPRVWPNNKGKKRPCFRHRFPGKPSPTIGRSWPPRPPQKRLFLAPAIEATLRSRQALQPLQAKSVPTLRCDDSSGMVGVVVVWVWGRCFGNWVFSGREWVAAFFCCCCWGSEVGRVFLRVVFWAKVIRSLKLI